MSSPLIHLPTTVTDEERLQGTLDALSKAAHPACPVCQHPVDHYQLHRVTPETEPTVKEPLVGIELECHGLRVELPILDREWKGHERGALRRLLGERTAVLIKTLDQHGTRKAEVFRDDDPCARCTEHRNVHDLMREVTNCEHFVEKVEAVRDAISASRREGLKKKTLEIPT